MRFVVGLLLVLSACGKGGVREIDSCEARGALTDGGCGDDGGAIGSACGPPIGGASFADGGAPYGICQRGLVCCAACGIPDCQPRCGMPCYGSQCEGGCLRGPFP
jgi:hypothetical protein